MKLSEFNKMCKKLYPEIEDPEIKIVTDNGFSEIDEVMKREEYYDDTFFGKKFESGKFICIEILH